MSLPFTILLSLGAGVSIPIGALAASSITVKSICIRHDLDRFMSYFGGGALIAAISLVLLPFGIDHVSVVSGSLAFLFGGILFWRDNRWLGRRADNTALFTGMLRVV